MKPKPPALVERVFRSRGMGMTSASAPGRRREVLWEVRRCRRFYAGEAANRSLRLTVLTPERWRLMRATSTSPPRAPSGP